MQVVEIELDDSLLAELDETTKALQKSRVEFIQEAVQDFLQKQRSKEIDRKLIQAYTLTPQKPEEYEIWQDEQAWE